MGWCASQTLTVLLLASSRVVYGGPKIANETGNSQYQEEHRIGKRVQTGFSIQMKETNGPCGIVTDHDRYTWKGSRLEWRV